MGRVLAIVATLIGLVGLGIDAWLIFPSQMGPAAGNVAPRSFVGSFAYYWSFFTHVTNLGLILVYLAELTRWDGLRWFRQAGTQALTAGYIMLVMVFYHFMLAPTLTMEGPLGISSNLLHYVTPILYLVWWVAFARHGGLTYRMVPALLLPGIVYLALVLLRGALVGEYPYDILDAGKFGYGQVAIGAGTLIVGVALFCLLLVPVDQWLARRRS